jgi:hypothetical protein
MPSGIDAAVLAGGGASVARSDVDAMHKQNSERTEFRKNFTKRCIII